MTWVEKEDVSVKSLIISDIEKSYMYNKKTQCVDNFNDFLIIFLNIVIQTSHEKKRTRLIKLIFIYCYINEIWTLLVWFYSKRFAVFVGLSKVCILLYIFLEELNV